jgi:hypothetical protein
MVEIRNSSFSRNSFLETPAITFERRVRSSVIIGAG